MLLSSTYFGNVAFWNEVLTSSEEYVELDVFEKFVKQTFRNRCTILSANGRLNLTIPVIRKDGSNTIMKDVEISNVENWQKDHWKAIESAYKHSPYFWYYGERINKLIFQNESNLVQFNLNILNQIGDWINFDRKFKFSADFKAINSKEDKRVFLNNKNISTLEKEYIQVFNDKFSFESNLCVLDLLMNTGPMAYLYVSEVSKKY